MPLTRTCTLCPLAANGRRNPKLSSRNLYYQTLIAFLIINGHIPAPTWSRSPSHIGFVGDVVPEWMHVERLDLISTYTQCG